MPDPLAASTFLLDSIMQGLVCSACTAAVVCYRHPHPHPHVDLHGLQDVHSMPWGDPRSIRHVDGTIFKLVK